MVVPRTTRLQCLVVRPSFWLSVHGCISVSQLGRQNLWLSVGQLHQIFWLSGDLFGCLGRTDNRNFERCLYPMLGGALKNRGVCNLIVSFFLDTRLLYKMSKT